MFAEELCQWSAPNWEEQLRKRLIDSVPGPCVLDLREDIILTFGQGDWSLVERDLRSAFSEELAKVLESCVREQVTVGLAIRRELINYKKLCLHVMQAGMTIDKDMRQLTSFFHCDLLSDDPAKAARRQRYKELTQTMNECRGAVMALHDARYFGKTICALPRHPDTGIPAKFEHLPESLEVWRPLRQAREFIQQREALDAYWLSRWQHWQVTSAADPNAVGSGPVSGQELLAEEMAQEAPTAPAEGNDPLKPERTSLPWVSERLMVKNTPLSSDGLQSLLASVDAALPGLPKVARRYVELVFVARGASKALTIQASLERYRAALQRAASEAEEISAELKAMLEAPHSESVISAGLHFHADKHQRLLSGMLPVMREMLRWLKPISAARDGDDRIFVSGSRSATAFVPSGFADLLGPYRAKVGEHRGAMLNELAETGWPCSTRPAKEVHLQSCRRCGERRSKLWLHRQLCFSCEGELRSEGCCPYSERCGKRSFCPHARRCIVCEAWSCDECRLLRGDGEDVWQLVGQLTPAIVFLDFDRTLATTKAGGSPLEGNHSVDSDLAAVCSGHSRVQVITRNSRKEDIEKFLAMKGCPVSKVRSVKREGLRTKAEAILEEMKCLAPPLTCSVVDVPAPAQAQEIPTPLAIFVDDDIRELTDPGLQPLVDEGRLLRFLFVRAGSKT